MNNPQKLFSFVEFNFAQRQLSNQLNHYDEFAVLNGTVKNRCKCQKRFFTETRPTQKIADTFNDFKDNLRKNEIVNSQFFHETMSNIILYY